ncbi:MAG TPA: GDSL-type esterase/lipase family protein, partial [Bdellovibrionota bacterium]|nr:GDSL-type esterase/lipase family protein [Bdellovibrionota bacterium]
MKLRSWFAALLGVALLAELVLRLAGWALLSPSRQRNAIRPEDASKLRILTLGESTTADWETPIAWPRQLENLLSARGVPARVYNEGVPGTSTALILSRIDELLERYRPELVVSMMGINDRPDLRFDGDEGNGARGPDLRLLKVARWAKAAIQEALSACRLEKPSSPVSVPRLDPAQAEDAIARAGPTPKDKARLLLS